MTVEIRKLKAKDFHTIAAILAKMPSSNLLEMGEMAGGSTVPEITRNDGETDDAWEARKQAVEAVERDKRATAAGLGLVRTLLETVFIVAKDDAEAWFADLAGVTVEEYLDLPLSAPMDIIEGVMATEDFLPFLSRAVKLAVKGMGTMKPPAGTTPSKNVTDGQTKP